MGNSSRPYVVANRDFTYTTNLVARRGQVFRLGGKRNDGRLIAHGHVQLLDPQPSAADVKKLPTCGECGRIFSASAWRDRCGRLHEQSETERRRARREEAWKRAEEVRRQPRRIQVGA